MSKLESFVIYNRFGQKVFETNEFNKGWDGFFKGVKQAIGGYVWMIKAINNAGVTCELKGSVVLIR